MKQYQVRISDRAKRQMRKYLEYLVDVKQNPQAASAVARDYDDTVEKLSGVAGSLRLVNDDELAEQGIRKIKFEHHDYVMLYEVEGNEARIHAIYHTLQDYENIFKQDQMM